MLCHLHQLLYIIQQIGRLSTRRLLSRPDAQGRGGFVARGPSLVTRRSLTVARRSETALTA
jgi:hypothetical protein